MTHTWQTPRGTHQRAQHRKGGNNRGRAANTPHTPNSTSLHSRHHIDTRRMWCCAAQCSTCSTAQQLRTGVLQELQLSMHVPSHSPTLMTHDTHAAALSTRHSGHTMPPATSPGLQPTTHDRMDDAPACLLYNPYTNTCTIHQTAPTPQLCCRCNDGTLWDVVQPCAPHDTRLLVKHICTSAHGKHTRLPPRQPDGTTNDGMNGHNQSGGIHRSTLLAARNSQQWLGTDKLHTACTAACCSPWLQLTNLNMAAQQPCNSRCHTGGGALQYAHHRPCQPRAAPCYT